MTTPDSTFPERFFWGAASSAYQVEGAAAEDGKGASIWDEFCRRPGSVWRGQTGDVACDHYHRYRQDVALMRRLSFSAYRFSVSWPRVLPEGRGTVNEAGLGFYERLVDELLANDIEPFLTLYHWDLPSALQARGGWLDREIADRFADYASVLVRRLSDRVRYWITLNEPQAFVHSGFLDGEHAPGEQRPLREVLTVGHHALLAHGRAVGAIRQGSSRPCQIGYAPVGVICVPATTEPADVAAARAAMFDVGEGHLYNNAWWVDPVIRGRYPEHACAMYGDDAPDVQSGDMACMAQPIDFLGSNIYTAARVAAGPDGAPMTLPPSPDAVVTPMEWDVVPDSLEWGPKFLWDRYRVPIMITENGMAAREWVGLDGAVHDGVRIDFMRRHLLALKRAIDSGVPVSGYFHWSIMDNFEWARGFRERFGLIHVNFETQQRTLKDSALWYQRVIDSRGTSLDEGAGAPQDS